MTPGGKMYIPNPYCTSASHTQSYPNISLDVDVHVVEVTNFTDIDPSG